MTAGRHFTSDRLGPPCTVCGTKLVKALADAGETTHPCCYAPEDGITGEQPPTRIPPAASHRGYLAALAELDAAKARAAEGQPADA